jgi:hypothetical protein
MLGETLSAASYFTLACLSDGRHLTYNVGTGRHSCLIGSHSYPGGGLVFLSGWASLRLNFSVGKGLRLLASLSYMDGKFKD